MRGRRRRRGRGRRQGGERGLGRVALSESVGRSGGPAGTGANRRTRARSCVLRGIQEIAIQVREKRGAVIRGDAARQFLLLLPTAGDLQ